MPVRSFVLLSILSLAIFRIVMTSFGPFKDDIQNGLYYLNQVSLLSDFQSKIGCNKNFDQDCNKTQFKKINSDWQLILNVPAGNWKMLVQEGVTSYGKNGKKGTDYVDLIIQYPQTIRLIYNENNHLLKAEPLLETRSMPNPINFSLELTDTLSFDPNSNLIANPGDSVMYNLRLKNNSGSDLTNIQLSRTGDPNTTYDPNYLKASPIAIDDTIILDVNPKVVTAPLGLLKNDFDLNDPLPNPPFNSNLNIIRINGLASNLANSTLTASGAHVTVQQDGSFNYDTTGINGTIVDSFYYTILDADGFYDSAKVKLLFNQPPVIASNLALTDTLCAFEQQDTLLMTPAFSITDDDASQSSAKIQICNNYFSSEDTLKAGSLPGGITSSWNETTGTLMLMGVSTNANYETAIESIHYNNQSDNPNTNTRRICITLNDGTNNSNQVTREIKIKPINDCPTAVRDTFYVDEDDGMNNYQFPLSNVLDNDTDPENNPLTASGLSNFPINGGVVSLGGNGFFAFFRSTGFNGLDSLAAGEMFFARVQYTITDLTCTDSDSVIVKVTGVNDAPLIASNLPSTDSICAFEQNDTFLVTSAFTLQDDDDQMDSAKISICNNYLSSEDTLIAGSLPSGITASWNDATGTLMLMGAASKLNYENAIESIQYTNQSNTPDLTTRRICITVNDGVLNSNQITRELKIKAVNDCPTAVRDTLFITENGPTNAGNVVTNDTDPENNSLSVTLVNAGAANTNVVITGGTINISSAGVVTFTHTTGAGGLDTLNQGDIFFARAQYTITDGGCTDNDSVIIKITGINDAPIADSNKYFLSQTNSISIPAPGILADDRDIDHASSIQVGEVNGSAANVNTLITLSSGASLTVNANGSFMYDPKCLAAGLDSFTYAIKDEHNTLSNTVKVYLQIMQTLWYVNNTGANGTGSFSSPFNTLSNAVSASAAGDYIFVFPATYNENITLKNNQKLIGASENWLCGTGSTIRSASGSTIIQGSITLAMNDTIKGIDFNNPGPIPFSSVLEERSAGGSIFIKDNGASVGNLLVSNSAISNSSATQCGLVILNGGSLNVTFTSFNSTGQSTSIQTNNCNGNLTLSSGMVNPSGSVTGDTLIKITGGNLSATFNNTFTQGNNSPVCFIGGGHTGTINFQSISAINGSGLQFDNADGTYNFNSTVTLNGGDAGVDILNGSSGIFTFLSTTITNPTNAAFVVNSSNATISQSGNISKNNGGRLIDIQSKSANTVTIGGNLSATGSCTGINVSNNTGGTINFTSSTKTLNTPGINPVNLASNSNIAINFTNGGLAITSGSATGFNATGATTSVITVTGSNNTISSTSGTALSVTNTTIGASGLNFLSISSNGAVNGIVLNTTGTFGGLTISGNGTNDFSGGTIQNSSNDGLLLTSTMNVSLSSMRILNSAHYGISGTGVTNFSFINGTIRNSGTGLTAQDSNIGFNMPTTGATNISGTLTLTGSVLDSAYYHGISVRQDAGNISNINISNNIFTSSVNVNNSNGSAIDIDPNGSATTVATITLGTINNNTIRNFPSGAGIQVLGGNANNATAPLGGVGTPNSLTNKLTISGNDIQGQSLANGLGTNCIAVQLGGHAQGNIEILNNGTSGNPLKFFKGNGIAFGCTGITTITGKIDNNFMDGSANIVASPGISVGTDKDFLATDNPNFTLLITNNTVSQTDGNGILATARSASGQANYTIKNNSIGAPRSGVRPGIRVDAGNASSADDAVCLDIQNNSSAGSGGSQGIGLRKQGTVTATNDFGIEGMSATATPNVESYVAGLNPSGNGVLLISGTSGFSNCSSAPLQSPNSKTNKK